MKANTSPTRLEIASRYLAGMATNPIHVHETFEERAEWALEQADALIHAHEGQQADAPPAEPSLKTYIVSVCRTTARYSDIEVRAVNAAAAREAVNCEMVDFAGHRDEEPQYDVCDVSEVVYEAAIQTLPK